MRIIGGELKGRTFDSPRGHRTHPMSEKMRGAIFNMLGDVEGLTFFDVFAGSGAIAFEALSRGAKSALLTDISKDAHDAMKTAALSLSLDKKAKVVRASASGWSDNNPKALFDIVIADPPYDDLQPNLLNKIQKHLKFGGIYVLSWPGNQDLPELEGLKLLKQKSYGDSQLAYYSRTDSSSI